MRLGDIMCAHREELEPLSIQAKKTMQFRKLDEERRQYLLMALVKQYDQLIREQESITQALNVHRDEEAREIRERMDAEEKRGAIEENIASIDLRLQAEEQESRRLQNNLDTLRQEAALIKGQQDQRHRRQEDIERMLQAASSKIHATAQEIAPTRCSSGAKET